MHIQETVNLGNYRLGLWIPDGTDRLKKNTRYAIRRANGDIKR